MNVAVRHVDYEIDHSEIHGKGAILNLPDTDGWIPYQSEIMGSVNGLPRIILRVWLRRAENGHPRRDAEAVNDVD